jgi:membrane protein YqaA with SNARE-associated domain
MAKRRRWWTALGIFAATVVGGVLAYLFARRRRSRVPRSLEEASVSELSARLREEAAARARGVRRSTRKRTAR